MNKERTQDIRQCLYDLQDSARRRDDEEDYELISKVLKHIDDQELAILNFWGRAKIKT
jgi:hypothetical protein